MPSTVPAIAPDREEITWAALTHLGSLVFSSVLLGIVIPIVALVAKGESDFVRAHAKESLNFQISLLIYACIGALLCLVVIGVFVLIGLAIIGFILPIIATISAVSGNLYRYPLTIRFVK